MTRILSVLFLFLTIHHPLQSQILPEEGGSLNYRLIGFSFPASEVNKYKLEIAAGYFNTEDSFKKNVIQAIPAKKNKIIAEVPAFGRDYTWRAVYPGINSAKANELHHFKTAYSPYVDSNISRLRIIEPAKKYNDAYVFSDGSKVLYDMYGHPVWYLPELNKQKGNVVVRDIKLSPQGTITLLANEKLYEINYNGAVLWESPKEGIVSGDSTEHFHHEFTKLSNGHYMTLGTEYVLWKHLPTDTTYSIAIKDPKIKAKQDSILANEKTSFGTIIEYDEKGNVVWSWKSSKYFTESDLKYYNPPYRVHAVDVHENSFFFDEKENVIYISFKNIARILKIQYPDGNVLNAYGEIYKPDAFEKGNGLFCDQHSCRRSEQGYLYLFNNNSCNEGKQLPKVVMMQEPVNKNDSLKIIWEYECSLDGLDTSWQSEMKERKQKMFEKQRQKLADIKQPMWPGGMPQNSHTTSGGNVIELPDHSLFVCMNSQYGKMFIIDQDKKNLWSAIAEKWRQNEKKWLAIPQQYRASIISRKELEQLIWNGEN